tara:strand:- start:1884 stop:2159 length:276 start_codon:yes stop_codon:yes gene_type:complete
MNVRKKNAKEKQYDQLQIDQARRALAEEAVNFLQEFHESEGRGVLYFSVVDFQDKVWQYEREKENGAMPKVGDTWDWENKVCGQWRYKDVV